MEKLMGNYVVLGNHYADRTGDQLEFGSVYAGERHVYLKLRLMGETELLLDPQLVAKVERRRAWEAFVRGLGRGMSVLHWTTPPPYVRSDMDRWEYLRQIALGRVKAPQVGKKGVAYLRSYLESLDKPEKGVV